MKRIPMALFLASALSLSACNSAGDSAGDNARNDSAKEHNPDTSITTDSRRNAPGVRDLTTDTGNTTQTHKNDLEPGTAPTKPMNQ